jgi:HTH-type transcriptional regulator/antitoxin MqsA
VLTYKGHTKTIKTLGWWCTQCGEGILAGDDLLAHEKAFLAFKAGVDQVLSPSQVAAVREKLGLSQRKASELLGGGPRSFQKYEVGTQAVSAPMSNLLRLLDNDPSRLDEIRLAKTRASSKSSKSRKIVSREKAAPKKRANKAAVRKPTRKESASG